MNFKCLSLLAAGVFAASTIAYADKLDANGIIRNDDGSIHYMQQPTAMSACPQDTHLPTIRELANISQANGAKGILEIDQVDPNKVPAGYGRVSGTNPDGRDDRFYFSAEGYKDPNYDQDIPRYWFWSSSHMVGQSFLGARLDGKSGAFQYYLNGDYAIARCIGDK
jgi:hypothetical protein